MLARLFRDLAPFQPTLIGTYPLGLAVDGRDRLNAGPALAHSWGAC
jgi:hypothetical protein